jgi:predicted DNA-binding transcriptional regulator YafY
MKGSASPHSRPPLERMLRIHQSIHAGDFPNATRLSRDLEVSTKSIQRDLAFMRDRLDLPLEYDPARNGYRYTGEVASFPTLQITEGELFALLVAEKALQQYRGTTFERPLLSAFRKMAASLPEAVSLNLADWDQSIAFKTSGEQIMDLQVFDALAKAAARRERLELSYRKPGRKATEPRVVDPYQLANVNGEWFLFAYCHLRRDIRTFVPARILSLRKTGETFARPQKFSLEKRLRDSFGVHSATGDFRVEIEFGEEVADYIREKRWHASQELSELRGGGVMLRLRLSSLEEVQRWILGWAGRAVVRAPEELRHSVQQAAEALARAHA